MAVVAIASLKASPGATTLATGLAFAWPVEVRPPLLAEADPDGGVLAARFGLRLDRTIADVAARGRRGLSERSVVELAPTIEGTDLHVLLGPASGDEAAAVLSKAADPLGAWFAEQSRFDAIVDVGRAVARSPALPLAVHASLTLLVCRPRFDELAVIQPRVVALQHLGCDVALVCVGDKPYSAEEFAEATDARLVAVIPDDAKAAAAVAAGQIGHRGVRRSLWWRTVSDLAVELATSLYVPPRPAAADALPDPEAHEVRS